MSEGPHPARQRGPPPGAGQSAEINRRKIRRQKHVGDYIPTGPSPCSRGSTCSAGVRTHARSVAGHVLRCKGSLLFGIATKIGIATNHSHNSEPRIGSIVAAAVSAPHGHNWFSTKVRRQCNRVSTPRGHNRLLVFQMGHIRKVDGTPGPQN